LTALFCQHSHPWLPLSLNALVQVSLEAAADIPVAANVKPRQVEFVLTRARALPIENTKELHGIKAGGSVDITGWVGPITPRMDIDVEILNGAAKRIVFDNRDYQGD